MRSDALLGPLKLRFTAEQDVARFGDGWYFYVERELAALPAREVIALEEEIGQPLVMVMTGVRRDAAAADLAACWLAVRRADPALAGPFAEFNPAVVLVEWDGASEDELGKAEPAGSSEPTTTVVLPSAPVAE